MVCCRYHRRLGTGGVCICRHTDRSPCALPAQFRQGAVPPRGVLPPNLDHGRALDYLHRYRIHPPTGEPRGLADVQLRHRRSRDRHAVLPRPVASQCTQVVRRTREADPRWGFLQWHVGACLMRVWFCGVAEQMGIDVTDATALEEAGQEGRLEGKV